MNRPRAEHEEPAELTPHERAVDDLLRFENFERYCAQSAATTTDSGRAEPPPRPRLKLFSETA